MDGRRCGHETITFCHTCHRRTNPLYTHVRCPVIHIWPSTLATTGTRNPCIHAGRLVAQTRSTSFFLFFSFIISFILFLPCLPILIWSIPPFHIQTTLVSHSPWLLPHLPLFFFFFYFAHSQTPSTLHIHIIMSPWSPPVYPNYSNPQ